MNIGGNIQELRKISGMTQEQLAGKLNVSRQTVSKWELGGTLPDLESALKLCGIFTFHLTICWERRKRRGAPKTGSPLKTWRISTAAAET